jgi:transposase
VVSAHAQRLRLAVHTQRGTVNGEVILVFLRRLLREQAGPLLVLWDRGGPHLRRAVLDFIEAHPRVALVMFPKYAPELNPVEYVWTQITQRLAGRAPRNLPELSALLQAATRRIRAKPTRLRACLRSAPLNWRGTGVK